MKTFFYDLETLDIFTATFKNKDTQEIKQFVISNTRDDRRELFKFLDTEVEWLIGYNSIFFDGQIIEYLYRYPDCTALNIRRYAEIITSENDRKPDVPEWNLRHKPLDLFKSLSLSVKAKRTSLKWCEFQIDFDNIEDLPSQGEGENWEDMVLSYNLNDVLATEKLFYTHYHEIQLRKDLTKSMGVNVLNSTEPDMAKKIFAKYLSKAMNISERDLRSMGTYRKEVRIKDIIFPYVQFKTEGFNNVLKRFQTATLAPREKFDIIYNYQGIDISFGLGGIHAAPNNKVIKSDHEYIIKTFDATSYYPHLMFQNNVCPAHIPSEIFLPLYKGFYLKRKEIPKSDPTNYIYKILLNSCYGLTNDEYSFLRDRQVTLTICINGQLLLAMLMEKLTTEIPECKMIMQNTDGGEILMPVQYENKYQEICKWWEDLTKIPLEHDEYNALYISDCNNYIGIFKNGKTKCKGKYEFENIPLHKNKSHSIIPKAVYEYFVNDVPIEDTIYNDRNIFNFCAGVRAKSTEKKGRAWFELHSIDGQNVKREKLSKTVRYYISKKGKWLFKCYEDGSQAHVEAPLNLGKIKKDWKVTYFNKAYFPDNFSDYNIDYSYYLHKAREWVYQLENINQLKLF
jgi:hypothetical protein